MRRMLAGSGVAAVAMYALAAVAQTAAGSATSIVLPVTAQTASFASEVTLFNPNGTAITVDVAFYEANNSSTPGPKTCADVAVPANRSVQFALATQCTLTAQSHFGLLVLNELTDSKSFYGYARVQNPQGIGFSIEGFPTGNFNDQVSHATGLKKTVAGLIFQTNCFVGSLAQPVSYTLKLLNDATGAQIGGTLVGSLGAFEQFRYLDIFGPTGVNAAPANQLNVRAEFTPTTTAPLVGFCTVQDNTSFGADFRIAKSYGTPGTVTSITAGAGLTGGVITGTGAIGIANGGVGNAQLANGSVDVTKLDTTSTDARYFKRGGNAFGATAVLGTTDNAALELRVNGDRVMRLQPDAISPNVIGGSAANTVTAVVRGATIGGGGAVSNSDPDFVGVTPNRVTDAYGTVSGGLGNRAGNNSGVTNDAPFATVSGGRLNLATSEASTVSGGLSNTASGVSSAVSGGDSNIASGTYSFVGGGYASIASGLDSTVGGGYRNTASDSGTVAGGESNDASGYASTVSGGSVNSASGRKSTVAGGEYNVAGGDYSVAMGRHSKAIGDGTFSFADSSNFDFNTNTANSFRVRAIGGVRFVVDIDNTGATTWSCLLTTGNGWNCSSDRNLKQDLVPLDGGVVLDKLAAMPVYAWSPKGRNAHVRHYGPMAQDFMAAFGLGDDDKLIGMQDADGVALAAIQGLNAKLESTLAEQAREFAWQGSALAHQARELAAQRAEIAALRSAHHDEIADLKRAVEVLLARTSTENRFAAVR